MGISLSRDSKIVRIMTYNFVLINYNNSSVSLQCVESINKIKQPTKYPCG